MTEQLIKDHKSRKARAEEKQNLILYWLRVEVYSTTAVLSKLLGVNISATLSTLYRMEKNEWIIKDEIRFMGRRAATLWGISPTGLLANLPPEEVANISLKHFEKGRVSPRTIEHNLDIQLCSIHCQNNLNYKNWKPTRFLPAQNEKRNHPSRWVVYPDAVTSAPTPKEGVFMPIAIEIERTRKTPQRYVQIIRGHLKNIESKRYLYAVYYLPSSKEAESLKALFFRLITEKKIGYWVGEQKSGSEDTLKRFRFLSMESFKGTK